MKKSGSASYLSGSSSHTKTGSNKSLGSHGSGISSLGDSGMSGSSYGSGGSSCNEDDLEYDVDQEAYVFYRKRRWKHRDSDVSQLKPGSSGDLSACVKNAEHLEAVEASFVKSFRDRKAKKGNNA